MSDIDYRTLLLQFIAGLTLADHMGDVAEDVEIVLKRLDITIDWDEWSDLGDALGKMGITTLHGTSVEKDD